MLSRKFGKLPPRTDRRTLKMARYLTPALVPPPAAVSWFKAATDFGVMLNDDIGDCTIAALGHAIQIWTLNLAGEITVPDADILAAYENWCGYDPSDPSTDQGGIELDVLNSWRNSNLAGHKLLAYADPSPNTKLHIQQAIYLFGGVYIGLNVPQSAMDQLNAGQPWTVAPDDGGILGGHAVFVPAYDADGLTCITWGLPQKMTWDFWNAYCDESHALLSQDWLSSKNLDPTGVNLAQLQNDLEGVTS